MGSFEKEAGSTKSELDMTFEMELSVNLIKSFDKDVGVNRKFTTNEASMAISNCILGAGIVSIPYGFIANGIWVGICLHLTFLCGMLFCSYMYLCSRDMFMVK